MPCDLVIRGGRAVIPRVGVIQADIGIQGDRIVAIGEDLPIEQARVIDAQGRYVFPGFIDPHVHYGNYHPFVKDVERESRGAVAGGITTVITTVRPGLHSVDLKDPPPAPPYLEILPPLLEELARNPVSLTDFAFHLNLGANRDEVGRVPIYYERFGVQSFKWPMAYKRRHVSSGIDIGSMYYILGQFASMPHPPLGMAHCETDEIIDVWSERVRAQGLEGLKAWHTARHRDSENLAILTACFLAQVTGASLYIPHVATKEGVEIIAEAQAKGVKVIAETCPHYLALTIEVPGVSGKVNPPIREQVDQDGLWEGIKRDVITCVGTDHSVRVKELKQGDIWTACAAFPGLEILMPVMVSKALERNIPLTKIAEVCAYNTAVTFGLYPKKGTIQIGSDADLVICDTESRRRIVADELLSVAKYSPYDGLEYTGWPDVTVVRGQVVYDHGTFSDRPRGRYLPVYPNA